MRLKPPLHRRVCRIVWSTDTVDLDDPFQRRWYMRQVLLHGRAEDVRTLDFDEVEASLDDLDLPQHIDSLWRAHFERRGRAERQRSPDARPAERPAF